MITLPESLKTWGLPTFEDIFKSELGALDKEQLPLQQGLTQSSYVSDSDFNVVILNTAEASDVILVKTGLFYAGVIAGSCCADDPTPLDEQTEYCVIQFAINKLTAEAKIILLRDDL